MTLKKVIVTTFIFILGNPSDSLKIIPTQIPEKPPFIARLTNLSCDVNEVTLYDFFGKLKIINVVLGRDDNQGTGKQKG